MPGDVKSEKSANTATYGVLGFSTPAAPAVIGVAAAPSPRVGDRFWDYLQLAQYTQMLQATCFAPESGPQLGLIFGTGDLVRRSGGPLGKRRRRC